MNARSTQGPTRPPFRGGFTLFEVLVTVAVIAVVAMAVVPSFSDDTRLRLMGASSVLASDIELAQVMTIAQPGDPVVVRFDVAQNRYWLARASTPDTPIVRDATGDEYLVEFGAGRAASAVGVTMSISDITDDTLTFSPQGGVKQFSTSPSITLSLNGLTITLDVSASTGSISETSGP